jgi:hypothetical protein
VNDAVLSTVVKMPAIDALDVVLRFPVRFSLIDPDPRIGVTTLASFFGLDPSSPRPIPLIFAIAVVLFLHSGSANFSFSRY